jgi:hypothetical protein
LRPGDYATFGVPNATTAQVVQASVLLDAHLRRPEGLIWVADGSGQPCYMQSLSADLTLVAAQDIAPGQNVGVNVTGPLLALQMGDVVVLDRLNPDICEACVIGQISGSAPGPLNASLRSVMFLHESGCLMEYGLNILEQKFMPKDRPVTTLSRTPTIRVISGTGRYGYGRRGDAGNYNVDDFNLLAAMSKFGGPPAWEIWDPSNAGIDVGTGQLWVPAGIMLAYYSEIKVRYIGGFANANLPDAVKLATAQLVTAMMMNPMYGAVKSMRAGETSVQNFVASNLSDDVKGALMRYQVNAFG